MPSDLKEKLLQARDGKSLNTEIVRRLEQSLAPDPAEKLAEALRPLLAAMSEQDRDEFVRLATEAASILLRSQQRKRPKRS